MENVSEYEIGVFVSTVEMELKAIPLKMLVLTK
jgi:hypothetical protein